MIYRSKNYLEWMARDILLKLSAETKYKMYQDLKVVPEALRIYDIDLSGADPDTVIDYLLMGYFKGQLINSAARCLELNDHCVDEIEVLEEACVRLD